MITVATLAVLAGLATYIAIAPRRLYRTGTGWCAWRWTDVDSEFITRLHVVKTPWFAVCVHWIRKPDPEPYLHDHPVTFLSLILRGWYNEVRGIGATPEYIQTRRHWNYIRAAPDDTHTIVACDPRTVTLCFIGPKRREWGYATSDGWVYWRDYFAAQRAAKHDAQVNEVAP